MITFKKIKVCFLLIFILFNIFYVSPCYSISFREDLFKNALDLSSGGKFNLALQEWNLYLDSYPDDAAGLSNRGNVRLVIGCLLYTSPSPRDRQKSRMPSSA